MIWTLVALVAACTSMLPSAFGQPAQCTSDIQCQNNYYCVQDAFVCRECFSCEHLNREPLAVSSSCVKSVADCGSCIKGLVEDRNEWSTQCVSSDSSGNTVAWWWWVVGVGVLTLIVCGVIVVLYFWFNTPNIGPKIFARASVSGAAAVAVVPSAPDCPPDYYYTPTPRENPCYISNYDSHRDGEDAHPFIKRAPSTHILRTREFADRQAAREFNKPHYVRGPHYPTENETPEVEEPHGGERDTFEHDENTMESVWSPNQNNDTLSTTDGAETSGAGELAVAGAAAAAAAGAGAGAAGADLSAALVARTHSGPHPSQDSGEEGTGAGDGGAPGGMSFFINVVNNIGAVQQGNMYTN